MFWFLLGLATTGIFANLQGSSDALCPQLPSCSGVLLLLQSTASLPNRIHQYWVWMLLPAFAGMLFLSECSLPQTGWLPLIYALWIVSANCALQPPRSLLVVLGQLQMILAPCLLLRHMTGFSSPIVPLAAVLGLLLWYTSGELIWQRKKHTEFISPHDRDVTLAIVRRV
jgi:hypothetical protein